ncbi:class I SAM-dependent methyltransferase [Streptacidiphilus sp. P02-A3a]|nr:class I SAM-dependent methyltransferase [Streptacidiphilus sp. P02-A3a]
MASPLGTRPWSHDPFAEAMRTGSGPLWLRRGDGHRHPLEVERWCAAPDPADWTLLFRCLGRGLPTLDLGCGPGRLIAALQSCGLPALGVDITRTAVLRARGLGGSALCRSVFDPLPGEGRWGTALLADGNLGIGGDPAVLLRRSAELLAPGGLLLVEVERGDLDERDTVSVEDALGRCGPPFPWARLGSRAAVRCAAGAGFSLTDAWTCQGRYFLALRR